MCWSCDHATETRADYLKVLRAKVGKKGWTVQYVERRTPLAYTVGLSEWSLPELLVTSVSPARASRVLGAVARAAMRGEPPAPGEQTKVPGGPLAEFVEVDHPDIHCGWAIEHAGSAVRALQVVWADGRGRWPWSAEFCDGRRRQPVLGVRGRAA
jgi:hypothetical protein